MTLTVRQWFRLARCAEWERDNYPELTIYFRATTVDRVLGPLTPPTHLQGLTDLQRLIAQGAPEHAEVLVQRSMRARLFRDELSRSDITQ